MGKGRRAGFRTHRRWCAARPCVAAIAATLLSLSLWSPGPATAQEVILFDKAPPSADELADIMFPDAAKPRRKYRGITPVRPTDGDAGAPRRETARQVGLIVNFALDSAVIEPESRPYLDQLGKMMTLDRLARSGLIIEGHTDSRGSDAYNEELSKRRAEAVKSYLVEVHGIAPFRLVTLGKGEREPLVREAPDHPANRRVQFRRAY